MSTHCDSNSEGELTRVRRLRLDPGEATPWHVDRCRRHTLVISGERLRIEFRDGRDPIIVDVAPGMTDWDDPEPAVHRAVNIGNTAYEEVVTFYLDWPDEDPQPVNVSRCD
ncbi:MAG TPA: hypothetical protein VF203_03930 [Burkholderiales bacterium]